MGISDVEYEVGDLKKKIEELQKDVSRLKREVWDLGQDHISDVDRLRDEIKKVMP
jgi:cell division protein FtsL